MDDSSWSDRIVGERMAVDREFTSRVRESRFSNQEWSLVMTATRFEIEDPGDPDRARLVANTEHVEEILPEVKAIRSEVSGLEGPSTGRDDEPSGGGSSVLDSIKRKFSGGFGLGLGGGKGFATMDEEKKAAEALTQEYAEQLQERLESNGRWEEIRTAAAEEESRS